MSQERKIVPAFTVQWLIKAEDKWPLQMGFFREPHSHLYDTDLLRLLPTMECWQTADHTTSLRLCRAGYHERAVIYLMQKFKADTEEKDTRGPVIFVLVDANNKAVVRVSQVLYEHTLELDYLTDDAICVQPLKISFKDDVVQRLFEAVRDHMRVPIERPIDVRQKYVFSYVYCP